MPVHVGNTASPLLPVQRELCRFVPCLTVFPTSLTAQRPYTLQWATILRKLAFPMWDLDPT